MNELLKSYLERIKKLVEYGAVSEAYQIYERLINIFSENQIDIMTEMASLLYEMKYLKESLNIFIQIYNEMNIKEIFPNIIKLFYDLRQDEIYKKNISLLEKYPLYYVKNTEQKKKYLKYFVLWKDKYDIIYADDKGNIYEKINSFNDNTINEEENSVLVINEIWIDNLEIIDRKTKIKHPFMDYELPIYTVYDDTMWELFLQSELIKPIIDRNRIILLRGMDSYFEYIRKLNRTIPELIVGENAIKYMEETKRIFEERVEEHNKNKIYITEYYKKNAQQVLENIKSGHPKILFITSRFTTALQYHTRDCKAGADKLGCETELLIDENRLQRGSFIERINAIKTFLPDIIFVIDHFREDCLPCPEEIVFVTWMQDALQETTLNKNIVESLGKRDIMISMFISDLSGKEWEMDYKDVLKAPISANLSLYKEWILSDNEKEVYSCDICVVGNGGNYYKQIEILVSELPEEIRQDCRDVIEVYLELMTEEVFFYGRKEHFSIIYYICLKLGILWNKEFIKEIANRIHYVIFYNKYKSLVVEWLIDAGYRNLKLYGNEWDKIEKFKPYSMGVIENGEKLSKALGASKISVGFHPHVSLPAKAIESIASGTLYLAHNIPEKFDIANAREYFKENEEIIYYYSKEDLLDKVDYYLSNEDERKKVIKSGQRRIKEELTYDKVMKRVIEQIGDLIEKRER